MGPFFSFSFQMAARGRGRGGRGRGFGSQFEHRFAKHEPYILFPVSWWLD